MNGDFYNGMADGIEPRGLSRLFGSFTGKSNDAQNLELKAKAQAIADFKNLTAADLNLVNKKLKDIEAQNEQLNYDNRIDSRGKMEDVNLPSRDRDFHRARFSAKPSTMNDIANAMSTINKNNYLNDMVSGQLDPMTFNKAAYALSGKAPFGNGSADGLSINYLTGEQPVGNEVAFRAGQVLSGAKTDKERAAATNQRASAGQHSAQTKYINEKRTHTKEDRTVEKGRVKLVTDYLKDPFANTDEVQKRADTYDKILTPQKAEKHPPQKTLSEKEEYTIERKRALDAGRNDLVRKIDSEAKRMGIIK